MKVTYEFIADKITGARNYADVEVSEQIGAVILELDREEYNRNRAETRRHESLSSINDKWDTLVDKSVDIEDEVISNEEYTKLHKAIEQLLPQQQDLIYKVFFQGLSVAEIARQDGVTKQSVHERLNRALKKVKKFLI